MSFSRRFFARFALVSVLFPAVLASSGCGDETSGATAVCTDGEVRCSDDANDVMTCRQGQWTYEHCMADKMQVCENAACVEPWRYGNPTWDKCEGEPRATEESLADKASYFEKLAKNLHVHPKLKWLSDVKAKCKVVACQSGEKPPCTDCSQPIAPEAQLTYKDVAQWDAGENDGLWSALYLTAEAYRYGATHDPQALDMIELLLDGERMRMEITGVPGLYTRHYVPTGVDGISCPTDPEAYVPSSNKADNKMVRVGDDGCLQSVDPKTMKFVSSKVCGLEAYKGWCFIDNVSQDEYSGHMLAHAAVARFVDDKQVQALNANLLDQIGQHILLSKHPLEVWDWDGRRTEHGKFWAQNIIPGYMAAMSLAYAETVAYGTGKQQYREWIDRCMLNREGPSECFPYKTAATKPYDDILEPVGMFLDCKTNWNVLSMYMMSAHTLLLVTKNPVVRSKAQHALWHEAFDPPKEPLALAVQHNALFDFMYAADKKIGPGPDGKQAVDAVRDGVCMLKQFPASEHQVSRTCGPEKCKEACKNRFGDPMIESPLEAADRCMRTIMWWGSPYDVPHCEENKVVIKAPTDFLLPYWMGRYYGFIDSSM